jgi:hypothetical protein
MDTATDKQVGWNSRDAWRCVLAIILSAFVVNVWLRIGVRSSPAFSLWLETPLGLAFTVVIQSGLWLFFAWWFSRVASVRDFLIHAGL